MHAARENGGASQAVCMFLLKLPRVSGYLHFFVHPTHEDGGTSQAVCMFLMKMADILRLSAPAVTKIAGRLRRFACP